MDANPFDDGNGSFSVLIDDEEHYRRWPGFFDVSAGSRVLYDEADGAACQDHIEVARYAADESASEAGNRSGF